MRFDITKSKPGPDQLDFLRSTGFTVEEADGHTIATSPDGADYRRVPLPETSGYVHLFKVEGSPSRISFDDDMIIQEES